MALESRLHLYQTTSLTMTPRLQQAIKMLQLSHEELESFINDQIEQNPLLFKPNEDMGSEEHQENKENFSFQPLAPTPKGAAEDPDRDPFENTQIVSITLQEHVAQQITQILKDPAEREIGKYLAYQLQPTGYFLESIQEIAKMLSVETSLVEKILIKLQGCEPAGVGARTLQECLALQLKERKLFSEHFEILLENLDLLASGPLKSLTKKCRVLPGQLSEMIQTIRSLDPKPGLSFESTVMENVIPEILVLPGTGADDWVVDLNPDALPKVLFNKSYYTRVSEKITEREEKRYLRERFSHASWLIKSLEQRAATLINVSQQIVKYQIHFFKWGVKYLRPLTLKKIAEETGLHESTISRVTTNKYMATPRGTFELKYFFNSAIEGEEGETVASETVRHYIQALVAEEDPQKPLSDTQICALLQQHQITVARRTVSKYRELMKIPAAFARKRQSNLSAAVRNL